MLDSGRATAGDLVDLVHHWAEVQPRREAFRFLRFEAKNDSAVTWGELSRRVRSLGSGLATQFAPGERALLLFSPGLDFATAFFGCLEAGIVPAPVYPPQGNQRLDRVQAVVADARASFALTDAATAGALESRQERTGEALQLSVLSVDELEGSGSEDWRPPARARDDIAFLQYTSGSTGTPKGVMVSHGNLLVNSEDLDRGWQHSSDSVMVSWLPVFHDLGLIYGLLQPVYRGFSCVLMAPFSFLKQPLRWLESITQWGGTHSAAPNFAYDLCVQRASPERCAGLDLSSWRMAMNGAEPVDFSTLQRFAETFEPWGFSPTAITPGYGLAEATLKVTSQTWDRPPLAIAFDAAALEEHRVQVAAPGAAARTLVGCGRSEVETDVVIVDPATGEPCSGDRAGEIWASGGGVAAGYWNRPEETAEAFHAVLSTSDRKGLQTEGLQTEGLQTRYLRTGDLGFFHQEELFIAGRLKDLIIIRGRNFYPQDIERVVGESHEALRPGNGVAFSVDGPDGEQLVVLQEIWRRDQGKVDEEAVFGAISRAVAEEFELQARNIVLIRQGSVEKTSSGKLQRRAMKEGFLEGSLKVVGTSRAAPTVAAEPMERPPKPVDWSFTGDTRDRQVLEALEARLRSLVALGLGVPEERLKRDEPLARYGMSSQAAVTLAGQLEEEFSTPVPATLLYDYPTLAAVSGYFLDPPGAAGSGTGTRARGSSVGSLAGAPRDEQDAVAVIGMGCRFPGAKGPHQLWNLLREGQDAVRALPSGRRSLGSATGAGRQGGFLEDVDLFDGEFFGIAPRELERIDPQHRLLLEVAVEALGDAALAPAALAGSATGVFVGISTRDYERLQVAAGCITDAYSGVGGAASIAANRVSYNFDFRGPSMAVDTACSSSLVAVHLARQNLLGGSCHLALAGGVNLLLDDGVTAGFEAAQMMAADGRCKTFDASADGYVRSEGCGLVVLKRLRDAQRDGDPILGVLHGSAINQDGRSNGITAPNGLAQEAVIRTALDDAGCGPERIGYLEAHGTGTPLGDPIEVNALRRIFEAAGDRTSPCRLGSVKTNLGHLESAAGIAGLIKSLLALREKEIPPHLHLRQLNPQIDLGANLAIATSLEPWKGQEGGDWVGVSSFGFGGTNAHVIVGPAPAEGARRPEPTEAAHHAVLPLSAKNEHSLCDLAALYARRLRQGDAPNFADLCWTAATGRDHHDHRLAVVASTSTKAAEALEAAAGGRPHAALHGPRLASRRPRVAFLFTGQGAQYPEMGQDLYASEEVYRRVLDRCAELADPLLERPLLEVMRSTDGGLHDTGSTQIALFSLEYALATLLHSWGIEPSALMGHSIGEYVAACCAGALDLEAAVPLVVSRGKLMQALPPGGAMTTVFASEERVLELITSEALAVAAVNGPEKVVVSGSEEEVRRLEEEAAAGGLTTRRLKVSHAFHSRLMDPMLEEFRRVAEGVSYRAPLLPVYSNRTGKPWPGPPDAAYWTDHLRQPVRFAAGLQELEKDGYDLLLEVGPRPVLTAMARETCQLLAVPTLKPGREDSESLKIALGELFSAGVDPQWAGPFGSPSPCRVPGLPVMSFQRRRHWFTAPSGTGISSSVASPPPRLLGVEELAERPEQMAGLQELIGLFGVGAGSVSQVTGKSALFISGAGDSFCFLGLHGRSVFALDYTGPAEGYGPLIAELAWRVETSGRQLCVIEETERRLPELRRQGFSCTSIGTWQDIVDLPSFSLEGGRMRRLRYLVSRYAKEEGRGLEEYRAGASDSTDAQVLEILNEWAGDKGLSDAFRKHMARAATDGLPLSRHRTFLVRRGDVIDGAIMILEAPGLGGYLMDMEFYRRDAALGWVEYGLSEMLPALAGEGAVCFSLGLTLGTQLASEEGEDPAVRELFHTLHEEGLLNGDANFQFKSKLRPEMHSAYLCRSPASSAAPPTDFLGALNNPFASVEALQDLVTITRVEEQTSSRAADLPQGEALHPLLERRLDVAWDGAVFEGHLESAALSFLVDHRVADLTLMPATGFLEVVMAAARLVSTRGAEHSSSAQWQLDILEPLFLGEGAGRKLQVLVESGGNRERKLRVLSKEIGSSSGPWTLHARAVVESTVPDSSSASPPPAVDLDALRSRCSETESGEAIYQRLEALGFEYGPSFQGLKQVWVGEGEVLGRIEASASLDLGAYTLHPALLDSCLHTFLPLSGLEDRGQLMVPVRLEGFQLWRPVAETVFCHVRILGHEARTEQRPDRERRVFGLDLYSSNGEPVASCAGVHLVPGRAGVLQASLRRRQREIRWARRWRSVEPPAVSAPSEEPTHWLLVADDPSFGEQVALEIQKQRPQDSVAQVAARESAQGSAQTSTEATTGGGTAALEALGRLPSASDLRIVVLAAASESEPALEAQLSRGLMESTLGCSLDLVQGILGLSLEGSARLWWVTRRAVGDEGAPVETPLAASLWGFGRVVARELPEIWGGLVDVDAEDSVAAAALAVCELLAGPSKEGAQVSATDRRVERLERAEPPTPTADDMAVDGTVLITGGLGGLGMAVARWLVDRGVRSLVLSSRRPASAAEQERLRDLAPAEVRVMVADVADGAALAEAWRSLEEDLPSLRGVVHAAGTLDDGLLAQQRADRFLGVLAPKIDGAWNLHRLTMALDLDFFVLFSSVAPLLGNPGQSNYAAANAALDALAHHRRGRGLPAVSINWGPWGEIGMAARREASSTSPWRAVGVQEIEPALGLEVLGSALASADSVVAVMPLEPDRFLAGPLAELPILRSVTEALQAGGTGSGADPSGAAAFDRAALAGLSVEQQQEALTQYLIGHLASALGLEESDIQADRSTESLGMDSLVVMELRNRLKGDLGVELPASVFFEFPSVEEMSALLLERFAEDEPDLERRAAEPDGEDSVSALEGVDIDDLSSEEVDALLAQMLAEEKP